MKFLLLSMAVIAVVLVFAGAVLLLHDGQSGSRQPDSAQAYSLLVFLAIIAAIAATALINLSLAYFMFKPLSRLRDFALYVADSQDYRQRVVKERNDEMGELVEAFNNMLASIERNHIGLCSSEEKFRLLSDAAAFGVLQFDSGGNMVYCNAQLCKLTGLSKEQLLRHGLMPVLHPHDEPILQRMIDGARAGTPVQRAEVRILPGCGRRQWLSVCLSPMQDGGGGLRGFMAAVADISDIKSVHERLERMAYYDPLTGLANRHMFSLQLAKMLQGGRRRRSRLAVILLDIDLFKQVNDSLGHGAGDAFLVEIAKRIQRCVRGYDTVARIGGDEFVVLLENADATPQVTRIVQAIAAALEEPVHINGHALTITVSMGIVMAPRDGQTEKELLKHADLALYSSKRAGRNTYRFFMPDMTMRR